MGRELVDDCSAILDITGLVSGGLFRAGGNNVATCYWRNMIIRLGVLRQMDGREKVLLGYEVLGNTITDQFTVENNRHPFGHVRRSFVCSCGRRVIKLYLPIGKSHFRCRICHDLAYRSSQEAHKYDGLIRRLGLDPKEAKELLKSPWGDTLALLKALEP